MNLRTAPVVLEALKELLELHIAHHNHPVHAKCRKLISNIEYGPLGSKSKMVKVIGNDPKHIKTCSCSNCSVKLEYVLADTTTTRQSDYGGGSDTYRWLVCPSCGKDINVTY